MAGTRHPTLLQLGLAPYQTGAHQRSEVRLWHLSDMRGQAADVCSWAQSRPGGYERRLPRFDPKRTWRPPNISCTAQLPASSICRVQTDTLPRSGLWGRAAMSDFESVVRMKADSTRAIDF